MLRSKALGWSSRNACAVLLATSVAAVGAACTPEAAVAPATPSAPAPVLGPAPTPLPVDDARGGRLYDQWRTEHAPAKAFVPDSAKTPEVDGQGGPSGNGTLNNALGAPLPNSGHDYRLKNLFGWDLRGKAGIYGPEYMNKSYVLDRNLLEDTRSPAELRSWLQTGDERLPALGAVLDGPALDDLVAFLVKIRNHQLPQPNDIFSLARDVPKFYRLNPGADAARGKQLVTERCARCHGADGTKIKIDDVDSVGSISRSSGYEIWLKLMNGHPGSRMGRQIDTPTAPEQAREILDLLAALCDRTLFPPLDPSKDVPSGDGRCGPYLK